SSDGKVDVDLSIPKEVGGDGGPGTNPERLFATGHAACFEGAMVAVARRERLSVEGASVTAGVGIGPSG
ncbi:MAG: OsmC family protein, partial [Candidatus Dormibacteraeota bacterium]|nr:OsmC family protein [Candidatus Dormibacteraeota bacterium]